jgi:TRAP transporter TAXI family solute receptor
MKKTAIFLMFITVVLTISLVFVNASLADKRWSVVTGKEGTFGYSTAMGMARIVDKFAPGVKLTVQPGYSTAASHTVYDKGETNCAYTNLLSMKDAWNNQGAYAKNPLKTQVYHSYYFFSSAHTVATTKTRTDINCYRDLVGKKFYPFYTGSGSHLLALLVFGKEGLNIWDKMTERQMGTAEITDAVRAGVMDALWVYAPSGKNLTSTFQELDLRTDLRVVTPNAEEKAIISKIPGIVAPYNFSAKVFSKPVGVDTVWGIALVFGYNFGPRESPDLVYNIVKAWDENRGKLMEMDKGFTELAEKGMQLTASAIDALPEIPVHPGTAKYLKEKGLWKDTWKIGAMQTK